MLNVEAIKALYSPNMETMAYLVSRKYGEYSDGFLDIFKTINTLGMRVALADYGKNKDGESLEYCQFVPRSSDKKAYIILSNHSSISRLRFNSAIMLYCAIKNQKNIATYAPNNDSKTMHAAKVFAANFLMPERELKDFIFKKDDDGNYLYLNDKKEISIDNINEVAIHFGVPFKTCAARILNVTNNIDGIKSMEDLAKKIINRDHKIVVRGETRKLELAMYKQLVNSLRYLDVRSTKSITLEKILRECVKNDALLEGVIKDPKSVNFVLHAFADGGKIDENGNLHCKNDKVINLTENQLVVLGNYELLREIAYEKAAYYTDNDDVVIDEAMNKAGYGLSKEENKKIIRDVGGKYLKGEIKYDEACALLEKLCGFKKYETETFMTNLLGFDHYTIRRFHKILFNYSK